MKRADWPEFKIVKSFDDLKKFGNAKDENGPVNPKIIYQPNIFENNFEFLEKFFEWVYLRKNTLLYVDEAMSVCEGRNIPFYYKGILTRGGERGIGCFSATQRPMEISNTILSESEFYFVFQLKMDGDREKVEKITGLRREVQERLKKQKHGFLIADDGEFSEQIKILKI